jgi:glutamate formiminotransferase
MQAPANRGHRPLTAPDDDARATTLLECVVNVSEGQDDSLLASLAGECAGVLLDLHRDPSHHRAVFTLAGPAPDVEAAAMSLARTAVRLIHLRHHRGVHPRFGVVDVVPFVRLPGGGDPRTLDRRTVWTPDNWRRADEGPALQARDRFIDWAASELGVPCFRYGPLGDCRTRSLPEIRRSAFTTLAPDAGPDRPHSTAGAMAVGVRGPLVAYNVWLTGVPLQEASRVAAAIRGPAVRALGFRVDGAVQVSCNLVSPFTVGPADVFDEVARLSPAGSVDRAELVGLIPAAVLEAIAPHRWAELGIAADQTIESRLVTPSLRTR